ncbi:hypothetical protein QBC34DRAFT_440901 [Podospora aff. communis PSN243]|uniref:Arrestin-like N-terminal domain-containing protein n=1 Tax=Podospora aff. communis PSN243 TaxID=3040156 RepID=A0AAV9GH99_9PEZI|nr:hypothetical protein QBC34DRAFT_440901 [Podospora aff. communis PSN243]
MPRKWSRNGPALAIQLDTPGPIKPGDTITGRVIRQLPLDTSRARLYIQLRGRDKVKLTVQELLISLPFRADANLLGDDLYHVIYDGPLHVPSPADSGEVFFSCPFAITLPHHDAINGEPLPFTFHSRTRSPTSTLRAFVDYWLEASLSNRASPSSRELAILPLTVRHHPLPIVIHPPDFPIHRWTCTKTVRTQRLLSGQSHSRLFLADTLTKTLCGSTVPHYTFGVEVFCPRTIQLDSPSPMPLYVRTAPFHHLSSDVLAQRSRLIELHAVKLSLVARTTANLQGVVSGSAKRRLLCRDEEVLRAKWSPREREALWLPSDAEEAALDVGTLVLGVRFGEQGVWCVREGQGSPAFEKAEVERVFPDFETYNIRHRHLLRWDMEVRVAMETVKAQGEQLVTVLGSAGGLSGGVLMDTKAAKDKTAEKRKSFRWEWMAVGSKVDGWARVPTRSERGASV